MNPTCADILLEDLGACIAEYPNPGPAQDTCIDVAIASYLTCRGASKLAGGCGCKGSPAPSAPTEPPAT